MLQGHAAEKYARKDCCRSKKVKINSVKFYRNRRGCCGHGAGPRSRELLTSGVEGLAAGEQLPGEVSRVPDGLAALVTKRDTAVTERDTPFDGDRVPADLDSDEESPRASPGRQEVGLCQIG